MIYFNSKKEAFGYEIENPICVITDDLWQEYATTDKWDILNGSFVDISETKEYKEKKQKERETEFKNQFFMIENFGYFRKVPKGYSSATEAMNTAFNIVITLGFLPIDTLTFYKEPDFSNENECTEEWLISNSYKNKKMTTEEFGKFYADFVTAWNREEHL